MSNSIDIIKKIEIEFKKFKYEDKLDGFNFDKYEMIDWTISNIFDLNKKDACIKGLILVSIDNDIRKYLVFILNKMDDDYDKSEIIKILFRRQKSFFLQIPIFVYSFYISG